MKKSTSKKAKSKTPSRSKSASKKSSLSLKNKKSTSRREAKVAAPSRKVAVGRPAGRKGAIVAARPMVTPLEKSTASQKLASQNGRQPVVDVRKPEKPTPTVTGNGDQKKATPPRPEPVVKTWLSAKELKEFRNLLLAKRAELAGDVENLTSQALNRKSSGVSDQSSMPIHMADLGSDTWEQDFTLGLIANEQAVVREIDDALARIEDRTYGICIATDKPISRERLLAKPWAKYCIEYARLREEGRAP